MNRHTLTAEDAWFLEKGQKDSLSRTTFEIEDTVVVCNHRHVMLAEFYDGVCPTCQSVVTIPFTRQNVEAGTFHSYSCACPLCGQQVTILFQRNGNRLIGNCPHCKRTVSVNPKFFTWRAYFLMPLKLQKYIVPLKTALSLTLAFLFVLLTVLVIKGRFPVSYALYHARYILWERTLPIFTRLPEVFISDDLKNVVLANTDAIFQRSAFLCERILSRSILLFIGLREAVLDSIEYASTIANRTESLLAFVRWKTRILLQLIPFVKDIFPDA